MKIKIKFRGQIKKGEGFIDEGKWVHGDLIQRGTDDLFIMESFGGAFDIIEHGYPVQTDTVGQFSGLHDKNGKEIYEGQNTNLGMVKFYCGSFILENEDESYLTLLQESNYDLYCLDVEILGE